LHQKTGDAESRVPCAEEEICSMALRGCEVNSGSPLIVGAERLGRKSRKRVPERERNKCRPSYHHHVRISQMENEGL